MDCASKERNGKASKPEDEVGRVLNQLVEEKNRENKQ